MVPMTALENQAPSKNDNIVNFRALRPKSLSQLGYKQLALSEIEAIADYIEWQGNS